jgi:undecaprenyl-diphosphatase
MLFAAGIALAVLTGWLFDARVIAWTETLPPAVHGFFAWSTRFGQSDWLLIPAGIIVIAIMLGDWRGVSRVNAAAWWEIGSFAAVFFVVVAVPGLVTDIIKPVVGRFRPDFVHEGAFAFAPFSFGGYAHYSFPSGHATTMGAVAVLAAFVPNAVTIPILSATAIVAISRVMIGVHFPSDVVAGALIGAGVGYLILRSMAEAGIVFVKRGDGSVRGRFGVLRRVMRGRAGLAALFPALWTALSRH